MEANQEAGVVPESWKSGSNMTRRVWCDGDSNGILLDELELITYYLAPRRLLEKSCLSTLSKKLISINPLNVLNGKICSDNLIPYQEVSDQFVIHQHISTSYLNLCHPWFRCLTVSLLQLKLSIMETKNKAICLIILVMLACALIFLFLFGIKLIAT